MDTPVTPTATQWTNLSFRLQCTEHTRHSDRSEAEWRNLPATTSENSRLPAAARFTSFRPQHNGHACHSDRSAVDTPVIPTGTQWTDLSFRPERSEVEESPGSGQRDLSTPCGRPKPQVSERRRQRSD